MQNKNLSIASIIVLYKHSNAILSDVIRKINDSSAIIILINNDTNTQIDLEIINNQKVNIINNVRNEGTAKGYNQGIKYALKNNIKHVLLLDQDSIPYNGLIDILMAHKDLEDVAIGTSYHEYDVYKKNKNTFQNIDLDISTITTKFIIGSGTLFRLDYFLEIGLFDENYYIDYYDTEWCLRADVKGFNLSKIKNKLMFHKIGENKKRIFGKNIHIHNPERYYFKFKSSMMLIKNNQYPLKWRVIELTKLIFKFFLYPFFSKKKLLTFKFILLGIYDSFTNSQRNLEEIIKNKDV